MLSNLTATGKKLLISGICGGGIDALVPSVGWQEGDKSMRDVGGIVFNAGGCVDAAVMMVSTDILMIFSAGLTIYWGVLWSDTV